MKLFISKDVFNYIGVQIQVERLSERRTAITIPHVVTNKEGAREISPFKFCLPISLYELMKSRENILLNAEKLDVDKNEFLFENGKNSKINYIYALLHNGEKPEAELWVPKAMQHCLDVIYKIQFDNVAPRQGEYKATFYFVKIKLEPFQTLPVYFSYKGANELDRHVVFSTDFLGYWNAEEFTTRIFMNYENKQKYISLEKFDSQPID